MSEPSPTVDEVLVAGSLCGVAVTEAQAEAIIETIGRYALPETPCQGLESWKFATGEKAMVYDREPSDFVEVHFQYFHEGDDAPPHASLGFEVTLFDRDGTVRSSQDFG